MKISLVYAKRTLNAVKHLKNIESNTEKPVGRFEKYLTVVAINKLYETYLEHLIKLEKEVKIDYRIFDMKKLKTCRHTLVHNFIESHDELVIDYIVLTLHEQTDYLERLEDINLSKILKRRN